MRVGSFPQLLDGRRQRVAEVLIVAFSEPVSLHDHLAAKVRVVVVERNQPGAFGRPQQRTGQTVARACQTFPDRGPVDVAFVYKCDHRACDFRAGAASDAIRKLWSNWLIKTGERCTPASGASSRASRVRPWAPSCRASGEPPCAPESPRNDR